MLTASDLRQAQIDNWEFHPDTEMILLEVVDSVIGKTCNTSINVTIKGDVGQIISELELLGFKVKRAFCDTYTITWKNE